MNRSYLRQLKYAYVRNAYQDSKLAREYRDKSFDAIKNDLGIEITNKDKIPQLKAISVIQRSKKPSHNHAS